MKSVFKTVGFLLFFSLISCEKDLYDEPIHQSNKVKIEKISANQLMQQISNPIIKNYMSTLTKDLSGNLGSRLTDEELLYFQMFVKENEYTSYSLRLNDFSTDKPYFLDFVIKTDSEGEKAGFIKYIPEEATSTFDSRTFTGDIEVINLNNHVVANNAVVSGVAINQASIAATQCFSAIQLVQHNCTHGGNHAPGEACDGPGGNNGYYEIIITNFCLTFPEDLNFVSAPDISMGDNSGGGFVPLSPTDVAFNNFLSTLTPEQTDVLATSPGLIQYIKDNEVSVESQVFALELITISIVNNATIEINPNNNSTNSNVFTDSTDLLGIFNGNSSIPGVVDFENPTDQNGRFGIFKFQLNSFGGIMVKAKINETGNSYDVTNVTSQLYGISFFSQWEQDDYDVTFLPNNKIKIIVSGHLKTSGFLNEIGLEIHQNYILTVIYDSEWGIIDYSKWEKQR